ncbi:MAG: ERF family protein, partial [Planctomycetota bacterium]
MTDETKTRPELFDPSFQITGSLEAYGKQWLKVQKDLEPLEADQEATEDGFAYAGLPRILELLRPVLQKHGIALTQAPTTTTKGAGCVTFLAAERWQLRARLAFPMGRISPQSVGAYISYARRYTLLALFNLARGGVRWPLVRALRVAL